jgi:uncharacterized protein YciI
MQKQYFFMKLIPPRASFATDMTPSEAAVMQEHILYWKVLLQKGICVTFGPVLDPTGVYGVAIVGVDDPEIISDIEDNDPSVLAGINVFESFPMIATVS